MSYDSKRTRERIAMQIARYIQSADEIKAMGEVRSECGISEEQIYQALCATREMALRDVQDSIAKSKYTELTGDDDHPENLLRMQLSAYNILQNAVERHERMHKGNGERDEEVVRIDLTVDEWPDKSDETTST